MFDAETYAVSKKYADDLTKGISLIEGKPCTIASITAITGGHRVTYKWTADDGTTKTQTMDVMDGAKGDKGDKGDTGSQGATGETGTDGKSATITIGSVKSGEVPSVENVGTGNDAVFDIVLPKGDKGDKGDKGEDGQDGKSFNIKSQYASYDALIAAHPTGEEGDAYFVGTDDNPDLYVWLSEDSEWFNSGKISGVKGDKGDKGDDGYSPTATVTKDEETGVVTIFLRDKEGSTSKTVKDGSDGSDGKSAYEVAVDNGFVGTEDEWLASLKGDKGDDGANGTNGTDGISPVANVTKTDDVYKIHIEDASGTTEENINLSTYAKQTDVTSLGTRMTSAEGDIEEIEAVISNVTDGGKYTKAKVDNSSGSPKWVKFGGFAADDNTKNGGTFLLTTRFKERLLFTVGNDAVNDNKLASNYSVTRLTPAYPKIGNTFYYDYANNELYVQLYGYANAIFEQISGRAVNTITVVGSGVTIPTENFVELTARKLLADDDLTSTVTSGSTSPITSGGVYDNATPRYKVTYGDPGSAVASASLLKTYLDNALKSLPRSGTMDIDFIRASDNVIQASIHIFGAPSSSNAAGIVSSYYQQSPVYICRLASNAWTVTKIATTT